MRWLACSLAVLEQLMFGCVGTFEVSRPVPGSLVRKAVYVGPLVTVSGPAAWVAPGRITGEQTCRC